MIFHAVSMTAVLAGQAAQVPVVLQCTPATLDPWWKGLLTTVVPTVVSLLSIGAGVEIAVWSFKKNRRSEQEQWERNQQAAHKQWILDNKKQEWQKLISLAAKLEFHMPSVSIGGVLTNAVKGDELSEHLRAFTQSTLECVFANLVNASGGIYERLIGLRLAKEQAIIDILAYESSPAVANSQGRPTPVKIAQEFQRQLASILRDIHALAKSDMDIF